MIPKLFGVGRLWVLGTPFLATSLVRGTCFSDLAYISAEVSHAAQLSLACIHEKGAVHGDITLANLMLVAEDPQDSGSSGPDTSSMCNYESTGGGGCSDDVQVAPRVMIVDFGRSYVGASREERAKEAERLQRILSA